MGRTRTTTGPAQGQQQANNPVTGLLTAGAAYDQTNKMFEGGSKLGEAARSFDTRYLDPSNWGGLLKGGTLPTLPVDSGMGAMSIPGPKLLGANAGPNVSSIPFGADSAFGGASGGSAVTGLADTGLSSLADKMPSMGQAAGALGAGLSAYDMFDNGINAGNALGLAGGLGAMKFANPWMMAPAAIGSIFDWW